RERIGQVMPGAAVANLYGPTEATVYATGWFSGRDEESTGPMVPIGRSVAGKGTYVLDACLRPAPVGVWGELYLAGGLARGYHERPGLTAERFVADPFRDGARLYRTGDVVRRHADGTLEYAGRGDGQVKVRGFRIELGEIESVLVAHEKVNQAVVVAREDRPGVKRLVAYVVTDGSGPGLAGVREHAAGLLPEYMVPSVFVVLDELPLNANGKLDRRALPVPEFTGDEAGYVAARTGTEEILASVWAEVLGLDQVGVHDNFFDLGGDSIISLQVVSRARRAGLALSSRDVFQHPTISSLAAVVPAVESDVAPTSTAEQGELTGQIPTLPAREWFFETHPVAPEHFNMSLALALDPETDEAALLRALGAVLSQHDALRTTFAGRTSARYEDGSAISVEGIFASHDLPQDDAEAEARWQQLATAAQSDLDLDGGPLVRVLLGRRGAGRAPWFFLAAHHLVIDGVSFRILMEDLSTAYEQAVAGHTPDLGPKTTSVRQWAQELANHTARGGFDAQRDYWASATARADHRLPLDNPDGTNTVASARTVSVALSVEETEALVQRVPAVYRTQANDVLLTALARVLRGWTGRDRVPVLLEGHGREELFAGVDLTRTVGWFTSVYPVALRLSGEGGENGGRGEVGRVGDWGPDLKSVKEQLRAVPDRGVGYGALRYLGLEGGAQDDPQISFNYHGHFDIGGEAGDGLFRGALPLPGGDHAPHENRTHLIDVVGAIQDGRLAFSWIYSGDVHREETVRGLAEAFAAELVACVVHCEAAGAGGCTPSDFPLVGLSQAEVDRVVGEGRGVEDVYPLTPLQAGMLFHALADPGSSAYLEQFVFRLDGVSDVERLARAWQTVVGHADALRVSLAWEGLSEPVQVVHREVTVPVTVLDWTDLAEERQAEALADLMDQDRARGIDLTSAPLLRVVLARLSGDAVQVVWTFHHVLLDGWSTAALVPDVLAEYAGDGAGRGAGSRGSFGEYVRWLVGQDASAGRAFWRDRLAGVSDPVVLPYDRLPGEAERGRSSGRVPVVLGAGVAGRVGGFARRHRLTVNAVVQGAWALLLSQSAGASSGSGDVVFGTTVSGRPADLPGVEDMLGLFINTVPVRVAVDPSVPVVSWLGGVQSDLVEARQFEYVALSDMETDLPAGASLFDSLVVFENYPVDSTAAERHGVSVSGVQAVESTNYALTLIAGLAGERLDMTLAYDPALFDRTTVDSLAGRLAQVLTTLVDNAETRLGALDLLAPEERALVADEWADGGASALDDASVVEAFARRVAAAPDAVAVRCGDAMLSYAELDASSDRLARLLVERGVAAESRVGLLLERSVDVVVAMLGVLK
ncbi:condensation domain-containing protein, partial [Streptomyces sp. NPDC001834]|uniref:condensation domain-containing protein n=1 Tax=Streptomyces sp. NPDC001834 TaxID=3364616 RepID=UPI00368F3DFB